MHRAEVLLEALGFGSTVAPGPPVEIVSAALGQVRVQLKERRERRHRDQEVPTSVSDEVLDVTLLVASSDVTEAVREQIVALQAEELSGERAFVRSDDLRDCDRGVVIRGLLGTPPKYSNAAT
jgi:hypothetical protein